jgi:hypothetical protein
MSSIVTTATPFINRELLLKALDAVGCRYTIQGNEIITDRQDYYGKQKFVFLNGRYSFQHDSSAENMIYGPHYRWGNIDMQQHKTVSQFINSVGEIYNKLYQKQLEELERKRLAAIAEAERLRKEKLVEQERLRLIAIAEEERRKAEEEKQRLERERKEFVEKQRAGIIAKAKEEGYDIQEKMVDNKIKIKLVQTSY